MPAKQVHVLVAAWYTHSLSVCSLFMWITVVVTVTTTHRTAETRQRHPHNFIYESEIGQCELRTNDFTLEALTK